MFLNKDKSRLAPSNQHLSETLWRIHQTIPQTLNTMHFISVNQPNLCHQGSIPFGKAKNPNPESRTKHLNRFLTTYRNDKGIRPLSSLIINHCFYPCSIPFRYATHGLQTRASEACSWSHIPYPLPHFSHNNPLTSFLRKAVVAQCFWVDNYFVFCTWSMNKLKLAILLISKAYMRRV